MKVFLMPNLNVTQQIIKSFFLLEAEIKSMQLSLINFNWLQEKVTIQLEVSNRFDKKQKSRIVTISMK